MQGLSVGILVSAANVCLCVCSCELCVLSRNESLVLISCVVSNETKEAKKKNTWKIWLPMEKRHTSFFFLFHSNEFHGHHTTYQNELFENKPAANRVRLKTSMAECNCYSHY